MPKSDKEHDEEWTSLYKEYKESIKKDEENATKKLNKEYRKFISSSLILHFLNIHSCNI